MLAYHLQLNVVDHVDMVNVFTNFGIAVLALWIMRQTAHAKHVTVWLFRFPLVMVSITCFLKAWERFEGCHASLADAFRDIGWFSLLLVTAIYHHYRFGRL